MHIETTRPTATARIYIRDIVYGANDGLLTTFAVVSGVAGGALTHVAVLVIGVANLTADGVSMGVGNLLAIGADERAREADGLPELDPYPWNHGIATFVAFIVAGAIPFLPYVLPDASGSRLLASTTLTFAGLFRAGSGSRPHHADHWRRTGLETLMLGAVVAATVYGAVCADVSGAAIALAAGPGTRAAPPGLERCRRQDDTRGYARTSYGRYGCGSK